LEWPNLGPVLNVRGVACLQTPSQKIECPHEWRISRQSLGWVYDDYDGSIAVRCKSRIVEARNFRELPVIPMPARCHSPANVSTCLVQQIIRASGRSRSKSKAVRRWTLHGGRGKRRECATKSRSREHQTLAFFPWFWVWRHLRWPAVTD
jgi:hypothetical protein